MSRVLMSCSGSGHRDGMYLEEGREEWLVATAEGEAGRGRFGGANCCHCHCQQMVPGVGCRGACGRRGGVKPC